ncbi:acyl-CoA dehydrogenase family protein [Camelimonas sp. ID_303_24]
MDFAPTEEQALLRGAVAGLLSARYAFSDRVAASRAEPGFRPDIWRALAIDLGLAGMAVTEAAGGLGRAFADQMVVMEELGRALVIEPLAETCFLAAPLLERAGGPAAQALLPRILAGEARVALAFGEPDMRSEFADIGLAAVAAEGGWRLDGAKSVVTTAPWADHLIVAARTAGRRGDAMGLSLFVVPADAPGLQLDAYPTIDGRRAADLTFAHVQAPRDALLGEMDAALPLLEWGRDHAIVLQAAEATGLLERLLSDTVAYCQERKQFGKRLSSFQALQHRMVDMYLQVEQVRSAAMFAALRLEAPPRERAAAASTAKVTVANACRFVGQNAVQLHGGMGMTDELPIGHYFKRATVIETEHGRADWHLQRHARSMADNAA